MTFFKKDNRTTTEKVDIIENIVYEYLKPFGFKKHGRVLHRFVDSDISQVVEFENGCPAKGIIGVLWVHLGIRVPECMERSFKIRELKKYYHEYECNIRTSLGTYIHGKDVTYNLKKKPEIIGDDILKALQNHIMPVFELLNSREAILNHRREFSKFDETNEHLILLEEAMIFGTMGDVITAEQRFNEYYKNAIEENEIYKNTAHLEYLMNLANELGIKLNP